MSTVLTTAGKSLIARLQAGEKLVIDRFIFADVPDLDLAQPLNPEAGLPENIVFEYAIPEPHRAYLGPDLLVYSAVLGPEVGDFSMNWQGLYCSQHQILVAASSFQPVQKKAFENAEDPEANSITRNFILKFDNAREITGVNVKAESWQIDFNRHISGNSLSSSTRTLGVNGGNIDESDTRCPLNHLIPASGSSSPNAIVGKNPKTGRPEWLGGQKALFTRDKFDFNTKTQPTLLLMAGGPGFTNGPTLFDPAGSHIPYGYFQVLSAWDEGPLVQRYYHVDGDAEKKAGICMSRVFAGNTFTWSPWRYEIDIVESWRSESNWVRRHADGWIEQGGRHVWTGGETNIVGLAVPFSDTNYHVQVTLSSSQQFTPVALSLYRGQTNESIVLWCSRWQDGDNHAYLSAGHIVTWEAKGY